MENPNTWTDLQWALSNVVYSENRYEDTYNLLFNKGYLISLDEIKNIIDNWQKQLDEEMYGYSLESTIFHYLENTF